MPFRRVRQRLLIAYIAVLMTILATFAAGMRTIFAHSLSQQLNEILIALAEGAMAGIQVQQSHLQVPESVTLLELEAHHQKVEWFNAQGKLMEQRGDLSFRMPFNPHYRVQRQYDPPIQAVTVPIRLGDSATVVGYVRAMQSLDSIHKSLHRLDLGLGGASVLAVVMTAIGGMVLTRQATGEIEQSFQRLKQFTADASHELRSPLTAIQSNASVALKYDKEMRDGDRQKFQTILDASQQLTQLTEDLLWLARGDAQTAPAPPQLVDLESLLQQLVQRYEIQAQRQQIELITQINSPLLTWGYASQLTRLFTNLLDNAFHYTPSSGTIQITATQNHRLRIEIRDSGIGIAPDDLPFIFDRFWQADSSRSLNYKSTGLGLAIAKSIVETHHGQITVTSQLNQGSCFTVWLMGQSHKSFF